MPRKVLTDRAIDALKPAAPGKRVVVSDAVVPGLGVRVTDRGHRTFVLGARYPGSKHFIRREIGEVGAVTLAEARAKARRWLELIKTGKDPRDIDQQEKQAATAVAAITFEAVFADFEAGPLSKERKGKEVARDIRREFIPRWSDKPIIAITAADVRSAIVAVVKRGSPYQAHNLLGYARRLFAWAIDQEVYGLTTSPCDRLKPRAIIGEKKARQRILSDDEIFAFWRAASRLPYPQRQVAQLLLLLGQRHNEIAGAKRSEFRPELIAVMRQQENAEEPIDWRTIASAAKVWTIGKERFKSDAPHMVPLSDAACAILSTLPTFRGGCIFSTTFGARPSPIQSKTKSRIDRRMLMTLKALARVRGDDPATVSVEPWVIHDLRRTMRTHLSALRIVDHVAEMVIGHGRRGVQRIYDQHRYLEEMREALSSWAVRLSAIVNPPRTPEANESWENVTKFPSTRSERLLAG